MEDLERLERNVRPEVNGPGRFVWSQALYTLSYLFFEAICFVSLLSVAIGITAFITVTFEYFVHWKVSTFIQTYITLFMFMNFACAQARHQALYIYQMRDRFGPHVYCCFYCTYPWSLWFMLLTVSYINLFYQFTQLFCSDAIGDPGQDRGSHSKLPTLSGTVPEIRITTALFLLSLSSIQYLTCRKLRWDYYMEVARMPEPPILPTCTSYLSAVIVLLFIQIMVAVLYIMPFLLWLLIARLFAWSTTVTIVTAVIVSILVGYFGSFVERQEPFPTINRNRMYHIVNLKLRTTVVCLISIPLVALWFFKAEDEACLIITPAVKHGSSHLDIFNFFLTNVCLVIMNTVKFSSLSAHAQRTRDMEIRINRRIQENRVRPEGADPFLDGTDHNVNHPGNDPEIEAAVSAGEVGTKASSPGGSKHALKEVPMDEEGNEIGKKGSSNGLMLKSAKGSKTKAIKPTASRTPMDCNSNVVQVTPALNATNHNILGPSSFHTSHGSDIRKQFYSDDLSFTSVKATKSDSKLTCHDKNPQGKKKYSGTDIHEKTQQEQDTKGLTKESNRRSSLHGSRPGVCKISEIVTEAPIASSELLRSKSTYKMKPSKNQKEEQ